MRPINYNNGIRQLRTIGRQHPTGGCCDRLGSPRATLNLQHQARHEATLIPDSNVVFRIRCNIPLPPTLIMKPTPLPPLRVNPQLCHGAESVLQPGETLSQFIEQAVRYQVELRKAQADFLARGLAAEERAQASGRYRSADEVIDGLRQTLEYARKHRSTSP